MNYKKKNRNKRSVQSGNAWKFPLEEACVIRVVEVRIEPDS
jgi:hypothetical protein